MVNRLTLTTFLLLASFLVSNQPAQATSKGIAVQFDWQKSWGTILPDTGIPSSNFNVKNDINKAVQLCGISSDYSAVSAFYADINGDGQPDYIDTAYPYFTNGTKWNCPMDLCTSTDGCNISIYLHESQTQVLTEPEKPAPNTTTEACPATAADNTTCRSDCPAMPDVCPTLFYFSANLVWDNLVKDWAVITPSAYKTVRATNLTADGKTKYRTPLNGNNILRTVRGSKNCTLEEMDANNDGTVAASEPCIKYYQYAYNRFIDMYAPTASDLPATPENDSRYTMVAFSRDSAMVDSDEQHNWRTTPTEGGGIDDLKLFSKNGFFAVQVPDYAGKKDYAAYYNKQTTQTNQTVSLMCVEFENTSENAYFIPSRTDFELESFYKAASAGNLSGVKTKECRRKYSPWVGQTTCPSLGCGETVTIAAERRCQRSSSAYGACSECDGVADSAPIYNSADNKCFFSQVCSGGVCTGSGSDCLPAQTNILMANGHEKKMEEIVLGDKVMGISKQAPLSAPVPTKVQQIHATNLAAVMEINHMRVSTNHAILKADGTTAPAKEIKVGDVLVGLSGDAVAVTQVNALPDQEPVFNFVLEGADGYIADGVRVMSATVKKTDQQEK